MRIRIGAVGTLGDVLPCIALADQLQAAGHDVMVLTHGSYCHFAEGLGISTRPLPFDPSRVLQTRSGLAISRGGLAGPSALSRGKNAHWRSRREDASCFARPA